MTVAVAQCRRGGGWGRVCHHIAVRYLGICNIPEGDLLLLFQINSPVLFAIVLTILVFTCFRL